MKKYLLVFSFIAISSMLFWGCTQTITYSEKFDGIPIYPGMKSVAGSNDVENYEMKDFDGDLKKVNDYYINQIDYKKWSIKENHLYWTEEYLHEGTERYILTDGVEEVSLIINLVKTTDITGTLFIEINASPFMEGKYRAEGQSEHWKTSLEYIILKDRILVNGYATYLGDNPPQEADVSFLTYEIFVSPPPKEGIVRESSTEKIWDQLVEDSMIIISTQSSRDYQFEIYKEAINNAYIEIMWEEQGEDKSERIEITVVP